MTTRYIPAEDRTYSWAWESGDYRVTGRFVVETAEADAGVIVAGHVESHEYIVWRDGMLLDLFNLILSERVSTDDPGNPVRHPREHLFSYRISENSFHGTFLNLTIGGRGLRFTGGMFRLDHKEGFVTSSTAPQVWKGNMNDRP